MITAARASFLAGAPALGAFAAYAALPGAPGLGAAIPLAAGFCGLVTSGVLFPRLQMFGPILCSAPNDRGLVALTFDDGPHPVTTRAVLRALAATPHRATFFVLGDKSRRHPEVLREITAAGHELGVHGYHHDRLHSFRSAARVEDELRRAQDAIEAATGRRPRWFRPPIGHTSPSTVRGAARAGVTLVGWSARGYDGLRSRAPESVVNSLARDLRPGSIVLLHDAAERDDHEPASLRALPQIFTLLTRRGLVSASIESLIASP